MECILMDPSGCMCEILPARVRNLEVARKAMNLCIFWFLDFTAATHASNAAFYMMRTFNVCKKDEIKR